MKKLRAFLAVIALLATMIGVSLQGMGATSLASTASSHLNSPSASVQVAKSLAYRPAPQGACPYGGETDC